MTPTAMLEELPTGRHFGASKDGQCWTMVGRRLADVDEWVIVPPASSLTLAWGAGGCEVFSSSGGLTVRPGDLMWIDAGWAHRGRNLAGSDFLTLMFSPQALAEADLSVGPIGAAVSPAPVEVALLMKALCAWMLAGGSGHPLERSARNAVLAWVRRAFVPLQADAQACLSLTAADKLLSDTQSTQLIADIAREVGLGDSAFSRRFAKRFGMTPEIYRKQQRLAAATRALIAGESVSDAAHAAGFADAAHLSRTFKSQYGVQPSKWASIVGPKRLKND